jgi:hypothetical protein
LGLRKVADQQNSRRAAKAVARLSIRPPAY